MDTTWRMTRLLALAWGCVNVWGGSVSGDIVERLTLFSSGRPSDYEVWPWNLSLTRAEGGVRSHG